MNQGGQMIIILLLIMVVSLSIGLSVVGRSITEISTSTNSESSSRAFSAAEAGIEKTLYDSSSLGLGSIGTRTISGLTNQSQALSSWDADLPKSGLALEYPPFGKESIAQFWLANPTTLAAAYTASNFNIYFGDPSYTYTSNDPNYPAIEVHVISYSSGVYTDTVKFFDSNTSPRSGFTGCALRNPVPIQTNNNPTTSLSNFLCRVNVTGYPASPSYPVMVRIRMLYTNNTHPLALQPTSGNLPVQTKIYNSQGTSGNVQRNLQVFQEVNFMPPIFDYAIFSLGALSK